MPNGNGKTIEQLALEQEPTAPPKIKAVITKDEEDEVVIDTEIRTQYYRGTYKLSEKAASFLADFETDPTGRFIYVQGGGKIYLEQFADFLRTPSSEQWLDKQSWVSMASIVEPKIIGGETPYRAPIPHKLNKYYPPQVAYNLTGIYNYINELRPEFKGIDYQAWLEKQRQIGAGEARAAQQQYTQRPLTAPQFAMDTLGDIFKESIAKKPYRQRQFFGRLSSDIYREFEKTKTLPTSEAGYKTYESDWSKFLTQYPWREKFLDVPQIPRGQYPATYAPPARWLTY